MNKKYEVECQRSNVTPKEFFNYCKNQCEKHGLDLESWVYFEDWTNENHKEEYRRNNHEDWDDPKTEATKYMPYDWQLFLQDNYNFIMEFEFDTETKGHGYMYAMEYER